MLLGAIPDLLIVGLFGRVLHWFTWTNIGPSDVFGWNATVPLTFAFWTMLFLYFLPLRTAYLIPYFVLFTAISVGMGQVTRNLGLFTYRPWYIYLMPFVFLAWYSGISWAFRWQERVIAERPVQ